MDGVAREAPAYRAELFQEAAARMNVDPRIVEKDFWVTWTLRRMFEESPHAEHFLFKGGTTLSKVFRIIDRFSEDIDIAVHPDAFANDVDVPRLEELSNSQRDKWLKARLQSCRMWIEEIVRTDLEWLFRGQLGDEGWKLTIDSRNPDALRFRFPRGLALDYGYIQDEIVLELGPHAEWIPRDDYHITSYAAEQLPTGFATSQVVVRATTAERTFWEKATILHAEAHRVGGMPPRYSRHYYDTVMLARSAYGPRALADVQLLERVVRYKATHYPSAWSSYETARPGTLCLAPAGERIEELARDYDSMELMFFGPRPPLAELVEALRSLESEINSGG
ncbi:MAG: nucleotidyl transferase AbiEii/AbiGii toxin family protein [Planctomycetota bacterium]